MNVPLPTIIQGGMGVAVSDWRLARAVSEHGQLGVVSGTALDAVLARRLQLGDPDGALRRAMEAFPNQSVSERILDRFFVDGGIEPGRPFRRAPMPSHRPTPLATDLLVVANFVEVYLAREGHRGRVGVNYLEKIQAPTLPSLFGAVLAGVDYVLIGAGIPRAIPGILDDLAEGRPSEMRIDVKGGDPESVGFDPSPYLGSAALDRPTFLAIVSSHVLATMMSRLDRPADGFVVEYPTAGGHNAPPRGRGQLTAAGEPEYTERDRPDLDAIRDLGLPFWLAGGQATPDALARARSHGAAGIQVGTAFAFCEESGFDDELKRRIVARALGREATVFTDPVASPTGFPFKVVDAGQHGALDERSRVCDLGYLRTPYRRDDEAIGWRCPAEPVDLYVRKGGDVEDTAGRRCLCNALMANVGLGQVRDDGSTEPPLVTAGDDLESIRRFIPPGATSYSASDVIEGLLAPV